MQPPHFGGSKHFSINSFSKHVPYQVQELCKRVKNAFIYQQIAISPRQLVIPEPPVQPLDSTAEKEPKMSGRFEAATSKKQ